ncbi:DNA mismatch repair protein MutT [Thalassobacillus devorans]|uniref:DNA mismatch repair protein MutT n=1 Tax=Thalassobacillus devorans TaxID=279813 RepID=A0ABQ1PPL5_9BACI|nr:NUDIX domain-containing protein [Thalassobacillus devorans]NIK30394.1 isopentenyldiphosphate isomerase [Thalassobacillus devorans]GGD00606.1 DNA mismatch repair protein MutT [Thalassobacillus devorans]
MAEQLTVFDRQGNEIGVEEREKVHTEGLWHHTFQCWFVEVIAGEPYIYFQHRSKDKKDFPDKLDITAAGHIGAEESIVEAGVREIVEELGIEVSASDLQYQGCFREEIHTGTMIDREFCHIFLYPLQKLPDFQVTEEVSDIMRLSLEGFEEILQGQSKNGRYLMSGLEKTISLDDFCPHSQGYFSFIIKATRKLFAF